jgi:hypothetical protein
MNNLVELETHVCLHLLLFQGACQGPCRLALRRPSEQAEGGVQEVFRLTVCACGAAPSRSSLLILGSFEPRKLGLLYLLC